MNKTVLIADDNTEVVELLARGCRAMGLNVVAATNATGAMEKAEESLPDVMILDLDLSDERGLTVCETMATHKNLQAIPVIILTEQLNDDTVRYCHQLRAHFVLRCPELWSRVEPVLQRLFDPKEAVASVRNDGSLVEPGTSEVHEPMNLIDAVFAVLGVETGDCLFGGDPHDEEKRSDQPWVLSIDDDDDIGLALRLRLKEFGAQVIRAAEGMEGYRQAFMEVPRAIILDYELPQCNGDYVLRRLKESPVTRDIPVIVLTGHKEASIERQMWELGASEYLTKPLDWNRLRSALQVFLDVKRPTRNTAQSSGESRVACIGGRMSTAGNDFIRGQR